MSRLSAVVVLLAAGAIGTSVSVAPGWTGWSTSEATREQRYDFRAERLAGTYDRWRAERLRTSKPDEIELRMAWIPGVSAERSEALGYAVIDFATGSVAIAVAGIDLESLGDVWLIDNRPGPGASAMPDPNDVMLRVGGLARDGNGGNLQTGLGPAGFRNFDVDQVVVTRRGEGPIEGGLLYGAPQLFERLHRVSRRLELGLDPVAGNPTSARGVLAGFPPTAVPAASAPGALEVLGVLIDEGEDLFNEETFDGNGRTCATCHPPENNLTIDPPFIARLPPDNPLFVAEFIPELNHELNGGLFFENPVLMREFGLIVENPDGFEDLSSKFVMRSVSHVFAQAVSINPNNRGCEPPSPVHALGWGGDGAPGSGSLRDFATGAVIQHAPLTLGREVGVDFRLPTDEELDALEAFQLSLGRQEDLDLRAMVFTDANVIAGQDLFTRPLTAEEGGKCDSCHNNAGALSVGRVTPDSPDPQNLSFDIGIFHVDHPALLLGEPLPFDDGFGIDQTTRRCKSQFNTQSIIEAADTAPFFHDNVFVTLEGAIGHYSSFEFNNLSQMGRELVVPIELSDTEISQIGSLLRVLNTLQNIDDVLNCNQRVIATTAIAESRRLMRICVADNRDAIQVLTDGPLAPLHPTALSHLQASLDLQEQAARPPSLAFRNAALASAAVELAAARADMVIDP